MTYLEVDVEDDLWIELRTVIADRITRSVEYRTRRTV